MLKKKANGNLPAAPLHPNHIGIKEGFGYMFGDIGNLLVLTFVSTYLKVFYTDSLMVNFDSAKVYNDITVLFLVVRLWDAINDPLWGLVVDIRRAGHDGKFRQYIKIVAVPLGLSAVLCFANIQNIISSYPVLLAFAYISYTLFGMLYTGINIPYGSLASVITDDPKGRTLLSTFRSVGGGVGGAPVTLVAQLFIYDKIKDTDGNVTSSVFNGKTAFVLAAVFATLSVLAYFCCYKTTKERVKSPEKNKEVNIKLTYGSMFKSLPFMAVTISGILISGLLQFGSFNQYLFKNYFGNSNHQIFMTLCTYGPMAALILFVPSLVEKFGKKELSAFGLLLASLAGIFNAVFLPSEAVFLVMNALIGFGYSFMSITNWAIVMDVIDYQENVTGIKNESAIYAVYTFARKLGQTLADSGGMQLLKWTGYSAQQKDIVDTTGFGKKIYRVCTVVPAVVYTVIFLLTAFAYPLSKKKLAIMHEQLDARRLAAAEQIPQAKADC